MSDVQPPHPAGPLRVAILGVTGSIGRSALSVVAAAPDRVQVVGLAAGSNVEGLAAAVRAHLPTHVALATPEAAAAFERLGTGVPVAGTGRDGLVAIATMPDVDLVLCASSGTDALEAVLAAITHRKTIALANKEVLVMAGALVTAAARAHGVAILPVDSEHNAIHQCLHGRAQAQVQRLILTASGGPFRGWTRAALDHVTAADALRHPTWQMGRKITIDSATLMNKGLEVIEAHWLFGMEADRIDVVVHPQSVVHSLVELTDGSLLAQLGVTDMRLPIQYAFSYPDRWPTPVPRLDLVRAGHLDFEAPDPDVFRCLALAYEALRAGGSLPVVMNAANEVAVQRFLDGRLGFHGIADVIAQTMHAYTGGAATSLDEIRAVDAWATAAATACARKVESVL